jgi:hypothetical protein
VEELFVSSGLGGYIVPQEDVPKNRWVLWYAIPMGKSGPSAKYGKLIIHMAQIDAKSEDPSAPEDARILGGEVCTEGNGATLFDGGFVEPTEANAREVAARLIEYMRAHLGVKEE